MFDVGFWEILLILILALVVIGPERLPGAARKAGYFFGKARRYIEGVRSEVESELDVSEFKRMLHNQEVQINELQQQLKAGANKIAADIPSQNSIMQDDLHDDEPTQGDSQQLIEEPEAPSTEAATDEAGNAGQAATAVAENPIAAADAEKDRA